MRVAERFSLDTGLVDCSVYDPDVYEAEMEAVFRTSWLFVGHVQQVPNKSDYITTWMGETPAIVLRGADDILRVFVNSCSTSHSRFVNCDAGKAAHLDCPSHRRSYDDAGQLLAGTDSPDLPPCVLEAGGIAVHGGLIFAALGTPTRTLRDYLGDAAWYLDNYLLREDIGGLELVPDVHRYAMPGNWKLLAENFAGDDYHVAITHASVLSLRAQGVEPRLINTPAKGVGANLSVATGYRNGVPHGLLEVRVGEEFYEHDLARAQTLSQAAADWVRTRRASIDERLPELSIKPYSFHVGNVFPTLSIIGNGTAMEAVGLLVWHPRGPYETAVSQYSFVDAAAPRVLKEQMCFSITHQQAAAGIFAPDDHENFERLSENTRTRQARLVPFNYEMGLPGEGVDIRPPEWQNPAWPGLVLPRFTEMIQRDFYRYWGELMADSGQNGGHA